MGSAPTPCFVSNAVIANSIGSGAAGPLIENVLINSMLLGLFAVQHSVMASIERTTVPRP